MITNYLPSLFKGMFTNESRSIEWSEVAEIICGGSLKSSTEKYRKMIANNLEKNAQKVKQWMPALSPVVQCNGGRRRQHFVGLTGVGMCDFDHLSNVDAAFRKACEDNHAFLVYRTISGNGVRVLFRVEFKAPEEIPDLQKYRGDAPGFALANEYFSQLLGAEADMKCKNIGRLSVLCHDAEALLRMDAVPFVVDLNMPEKVKSTSLKRAVRAIEQRLAEEGLKYTDGSYNEYVMRTGYYLNSLGVAKENAVTWAIERFDDYDKEQVKSIINSCYTHTDEFDTLAIQALSKKRQQKETIRYASVEDIENFLSSVAQFRFNVISRKVEVAPSSLPLGGGSLQHTHPETLISHLRFFELTDRDVNSLWSAMSKTGVNVKLQHIYSVICSNFVPQWNPFEEYFNSLPEWDGTTDYIGRVAEMVSIRSEVGLTPYPSPKGEGSCWNLSSQNSHHSSDSGSCSNLSTHQLVNSLTFTNCFRKWFVAMVAALLDERVVNNTILVFVGKQGIYKTTFFNNLLPPELQKYFFTKTNSDRMTKDDKLSLAEFALICLEEIDSLKSSELNQLKALVTTKTISERAAYERFKEGRRHIASFCGTGNNIRFLTDSTGNRRWLPFEIINIDEPKPEKYHYDGLYSQALALWKSGFRYWFNQEEINALVGHVSNFEVTSTEEELLLTYFRKPLPNEQCLYLTCSNIVEKINIYTKKPLSPIQVGRALRKHEFESVHNRKGTFYSIVEYSGAEIAMNRKFTEPSNNETY